MKEVIKGLMPKHKKFSKIEKHLYKEKWQQNVWNHSYEITKP